MSEKNIKEGDEVSWKWGTGKPSGTVEEVVTEGKLEIESKGKLVHKNSSPPNPAVHVGREGNDVVKRASELTKESSASASGGDSDDKKAGGSNDAEKEKEGKPEDKQVAGEKRDREAMEDATETPVPKEQEDVEKDAGKETKKAKVEQLNGGSKSGENGAAEKECDKDEDGGDAPSPPKKRGPGRPKKSERSESSKKVEAPADAPSKRTRSKAS